MTTQSIGNPQSLSAIPQPLGKLVCSFVPYEAAVTLPVVSKALKELQKVWAQQEWMKLLSSQDKLPFLAPPENGVEVTLDDLRRGITAVFSATANGDIVCVLGSLIRFDATPEERALYVRLIKKVVENIQDEDACLAGIMAFQSRQNLIKRARSIQQEGGEGFKTLWEQQKALLSRTPAGCAILRQQQEKFAQNIEQLAPFATIRFQEMEGPLPKIDQEVDMALSVALRGHTVVGIHENPAGILTALKPEGVDFEAGFHHVKQARDYLHTAPREILEKPRFLDLHNLGGYFTHLPIEVTLFSSLTSLDLKQNHLEDLPDALVRLKNLKQINLSQNQFTHVPKALMQMPSLLECGSRIDLTDNPIRVLPEEVYDHFFTWAHRLGKTFGRHYWMGVGQDFFYGWAAGGFCFNRNKVEEIPFSLWLRETILFPNWLWSPYISHVHWWDWDSYKIVSTAVIALLHLIYFPFWLINRFLSLAIVPIVTKIRELLGYGRMIRINAGELL